MEQIIHRLNNKNYLLVEILITSSSNRSKLEKKLKRHSCIYQGVKEIKSGGLFSSAHAVIKVLVPEENVEQFNEDD